MRACGKFLGIALKRYLSLKMAIDYSNWLSLEDHIFMNAFMSTWMCVGYAPVIKVVSPS